MINRVILTGRPTKSQFYDIPLRELLSHNVL